MVVRSLRERTTFKSVHFPSRPLFQLRSPSPRTPPMPARLLAAFALLVPLAARAADPAERITVPVESATPDPKLAKIVLVAGPRAPKNVGEHEYLPGCRVLHHLLGQT